MILALKTDLYWVLSGRIVTALIAVANLRVMTSFLAPEDLGIYTLLLAFQGLCGLFLINPVGQHINRHTHFWWDEGSLLKRLAGYNHYLIAVSICIAIIVLIWWIYYPGPNHLIKDGMLAALSVSSLVYVGTWNGTFIYILNMLGFRSTSVTWMLITSTVGLVFSSILAYKYHTGMSWLLGQAVGMLVGVIGAGLMLAKQHISRGEITKHSNKLPKLLDRQTILTYCLPLAAATGLMWLQNTGYRFWVSEIWGVAELGIFAIGLNISTQLWAIIESLSMQLLNPYFFRHITEVQTEKHKASILSDLINIMWPVYAVLAGFNIIFAPSLLNVLTESRYHSAVKFVMLGVIIEFSRCTTNLWSYTAQIQRRTTNTILPYGLGAVIVWLGILMVTYFNQKINILAIVLILSSLVVCMSMILMMQKMLNVKLDIRRWLVGSGVLLICLVAGFKMPIAAQGIYDNIFLLIIGFSITGSLMIALLWHNPALKRLLSVSLRSS